MEDRNMAKRVISKKSKRRLMIFGTLSAFAIGYFVITCISYIYNFTSLRREEARLKNELNSLQEEKASLKIEIQKLNNPEYVARYAKEKYLYSKDGEYVLKIDTKETKEKENTKPNNAKLIIISGGCILFLGIVLVIKRKSRSK